jgi:hypothetical protein
MRVIVAVSFGSAEAQDLRYSGADLAARFAYFNHGILVRAGVGR